MKSDRSSLNYRLDDPSWCTLLSQTHVSDVLYINGWRVLDARSAFKLLRFEFNITQTLHTLPFREDMLRRSQRFQEICEANYPLD
jgi:hypothetical protein